MRRSAVHDIVMNRPTTACEGDINGFLMLVHQSCVSQEGRWVVRILAALLRDMQDEHRREAGIEMVEMPLLELSRKLRSVRSS